MTKSVFYSQVEDEELYVEIGEVDKDGEIFLLVIVLVVVDEDTEVNITTPSMTNTMSSVR